MSTQQLRGLATPKASGPVQALERRTQIRCHLLCVRRQLSRLHFDHILFHVLGILRAIEMVDSPSLSSTVKTVTNEASSLNPQMTQREKRTKQLREVGAALSREAFDKL